MSRGAVVDNHHALLMSARSNNFEVFKFLLNYLDINLVLRIFPYICRRTPFEIFNYFMSENGHKLEYEFIIEGMINALDSENDKILLFLLEYFEKRGFRKPDLLETLIMKAIEFDRILLITVLNLKTFDKEFLDNMMTYAIERGAVRSFKVLFSRGCLFDKNKNTNILLSNAILGNNIEVVSILLNTSKNIDLHNDNVKQILNKITENHIEMLSLLLKYGFNIDITNIRQNTLLIYASSNNYITLVNFLLDNGADINKNNIDGTSLYRASQKNNIEIVKLLLTRGANTELTNNHGKTPLMIACYLNHLDVVKNLLNRGADVNKICFQEYTPLMYASMEGSTDVVRYLLRNTDVDLNYLNERYNYTALTFAILSRNLNCMKLLLRYGANLFYSEEIPEYHNHLIKMRLFQHIKSNYEENYLEVANMIRESYNVYSEKQKKSILKALESVGIYYPDELREFIISNNHIIKDIDDFFRD